MQTQTEFLHAAFKSYNNPMMVSVSEFETDIKRFSYLNTSIVRFKEDFADVRLRNIINHIVIISNQFGVNTATKMIRFKCVEHLIIVETIMYFLKMISTAEYLDFKLLNKLENL